MSNVFFANGTSDIIHVDVNDSGEPTTLAAFTPASKGASSVSCNTFSCATSVTVEAGTFATGDGTDNNNKISVKLDREQREQIWSVKTKNLQTGDLYIFIFNGSIVGQDENGNGVGFTIEPWKDQQPLSAVDAIPAVERPLDE